MQRTRSSLRRRLQCAFSVVAKLPPRCKTPVDTGRRVWAGTWYAVRGAADWEGGVWRWKALERRGLWRIGALPQPGATLPLLVPPTLRNGAPGGERGTNQA